MKKIFLSKITVLVFSLLVVSSCQEDFLDLQPHQSINLDNAITSIDGYKSAVFGVYSALQSANYYGRYFVLVPDVMSDDLKQNAQANRARDFSDFQSTSLDAIASGMWNSIYNGILRTNVIINANAQLPDAVKNQQDQYIGEAYTLRALGHFDLVRMFAQHYGFTAGNDHPGVPISLSFDPDARPSRSTVAQVYAQVVSDLETAIPLLKVRPTNGSRISQEAAKALLARVNLYMGNYAKVDQLATEVIDSKKYTLLSNAAYVDSWNKGLSSESIFNLVYSTADDNGSDALGRMFVVEGYGDYLPSADLLDIIPDGDVRKSLFKTDSKLSGVYGTLRVNKYPNPAVQNNSQVIRLSEMYLIRAEARARLGNEDGARADLDLIRMRGLPSAAAVTATGQELIDEILKEKRIELMFEGHRLWDLMRVKKNIVRNNCTNSVCEVIYPNPRVIAPIPQSEIDANENVTQNPDY